MCARLGITSLRGRNPLTGLSGLQPRRGAPPRVCGGRRNPLTGLSGLQREWEEYDKALARLEGRNPLTGLSGLQLHGPHGR